MNQPRPGPRRLSQALVVMLILTGGHLAWTRYRHAQAETAATRAEAALIAARSRLDQAIAAEARAGEVRRQLADAETEGVVGTLDRLAWQERLRALRSALQLQRLDLELGPEHALDAAAPRARASTLHFSGPIAHEARLLHFLAQLRQTSGALTVPRHCRVSRAPQASTAEPDGQLLADCEVDFITLRR